MSSHTNRHHKPLSSRMQIGPNQCRIIARTTLADFMAMTGISRDYISETGNVDDLSALDAHPDSTILVFDPALPKGCVRTLDPSRLRYPSAAAKRAALQRARITDETRRAARIAQKASDKNTAHQQTLLAIATLLYGYDRHNLDWDAAAHSTRDTYLSRAEAVLQLANGH